MRKIRESCDPEMKFASSCCFGSDLPKYSNVLIDDIAETIVVRKNRNGMDDFEFYTFQEIDEIGRKAILASAKGRQLREKTRMEVNG